MKSAGLVRQAIRLHAEGWSQRAIAGELGVSTSTVSRWIGLGPAAIQPARVLKDRSACPTDCPLRDVLGTEYAYLLGQYLGDGWIGATGSSGVHRLEIACCEAYPRVVDEVEAAIAAVVPVSAVGRRAKPGAIVVSSYSTHWPCLFPQHGPGRKHERSIVLEPWQRTIALDEFPASFVRGLIHSDGWRGVNRSRGANGTVYEYSRYQFCNRSDDIQRLFVEACDRLGVQAKQMNRWTVAVSTRADVARLDEFVGPKC